MISVTKKCTGCGSCAAICPVKCIEMKNDAEGFRQPVVDTSKCINCNRCEQGCPLINKISLNRIPDAFAVKNKNDVTRKGSSSGGVFFDLAAQIISDGGAVCAAVYDDDLSVIHKLAFSVDELDSFKGAKYAQSSADHCFPIIKDMLMSQRTVIFVGTPCQCAGLASYVGSNHPCLILVDMICHGVPSPYVWKKYLEERSKIDADGDAICKINLRCKDTGWSRYAYSVSFSYANGIRYRIPQDKDPFMQGFTSNLFLRRSCEACAFKGIQRFTDLTLGDYWGIWDIHPEFDDDRGCSLLWIHSEKGRLLWKKICTNFDYISTSIEESVYENNSACNSIIAHDKRMHFFNKLHNGSEVITLIKECLDYSEKPPLLWYRFWAKIKRMVNLHNERNT